MKRLHFFLLTLIFVGLSLHTSAQNMVEQDLGKIKMKVPDTFYKMTNDDIVGTFNMLHIPMAMYTNQERDVFLSVNERVDSLTRNSKIKYQASSTDYQEDLGMYKMFQKAGLYNVYEKLKFEADTLVMDDKEKYILFVFESSIAGEDSKGEQTSSESYEFIKHVFVKNRTYIINFRCPLEKRDEWENLAEIMWLSAKK